MAARRTYPNSNFAWYNDDSRLAVVCVETDNTSGERTTEKYDTWQGQGDLSGTITNIAQSSTTVTVTSSNSLQADDRVTISGTTNYNGTFTVATASSSQYTYTTSSGSPATETSGSWVTKHINDGLRITYISKYEEATAINKDLYSDLGMDTGMQMNILYYVKARLYEDAGDLEKASYFRNLFTKGIHQYPSKRSGVRTLSLPRL